MSDEFIKVATQEINDELSSINSILESCTTDLLLKNKSNEIEGHMHKIKGLSPMMGQKEIGEISALIDTLLKTENIDNTFDGLLQVVIESIQFMKNAMNGNIENFEELKQKITTKYSKFLN